MVFIIASIFVSIDTIGHPHIGRKYTFDVIFPEACPHAFSKPKTTDKDV